MRGGAVRGEPPSEGLYGGGWRVKSLCDWSTGRAVYIQVLKEVQVLLLHPIFEVLKWRPGIIQINK
jgi:hypothetical protein